MSFGRIRVICPVGVVTGGSELLHQLVHELRGLGRDAAVCYWPPRADHVREPAYLRYDAPLAPFEDRAGDLVIFPEALTLGLSRVRQAQAAVWWLSVDNFLGFPQDHAWRAPWVWKANRLYDPVRHLKMVLRKRRTLGSMRDVLHFAQSHYALDFLAKAGLPSRMLGDYLGDEHLAPLPPDLVRRDVIAYNPKKGARVTARLREAFPDLEFRPIQNMTPAQVADFLRSSKLYIDFGHHPGKDRPPREAVMAGCCVITGRSGAAAWPQDTPTPDAWRLDPRSPDFLRAFRARVDEVFADHARASLAFEPWRERVRGERALFHAQVLGIFGAAAPAA